MTTATVRTCGGQSSGRQNFSDISPTVRKMLSDTLKTKDRRRRHAKFRKLIIAASEEQFENQTKGYDYFIDLNDKIEAYHSDCVNQMLDYCETVEKWLADNCKGEYICFPPGMGKYLCKSNGIYFKSKDDAFLFKLLF